MDILSKANSIVSEYDQIMQQMMDNDIMLNQDKMTSLSRQKSALDESYQLCKQYIDLKNQLAELDEMRNDKEYEELAKEESIELNSHLESIEKQLKKILISDDPNDNKNAIIEIRAGTGGDEAGLFASDLMRMYSRYAENNNLKVKIMDIHETGVGGLKSATFSIEGPKAYGVYKYEGGVHRVQRIPKTESGGRVHTSAATVMVLPEAEEFDVEINMSEVRVDYFCSSGPGGQSVNTTYSAVRLTHEPTGVVAQCQDQKSQHKNKEKAMKVLRSRLYEIELNKRMESDSQKRNELVKSGDRSAKIRTYNYPQGRVTDHRIKLTLYSLEEIMSGELDSVIQPLINEHQADLLVGLSDEI